MAESRIGPYENAIQYFLNFSYEIPLSSIVSLKSGFLYKTDLNYSTLNINTIVSVNKIYCMGVNYVHDISAGPMFGIDIKGKLRLGYAFDYPTNSLASFTNGSH